MHFDLGMSVQSAPRALICTSFQLRGRLSAPISSESIGQRKGPVSQENSRRPAMRRTIAPTALVFVLATVFVVGVAPTAQPDDHKDCSAASLQGSFGFTSTGTLLALPPP